MDDKRIWLKLLEPSDGIEIYEMLQQIDSNENEFTNPVKGMTYEQYKEWLVEQQNYSKGINLKDGHVPQTIYWLMDGEHPIGMGKIRHQLTEQSREQGGNIGLAIAREYRGLGYGSIMLSKILCVLNEMKIQEVLYTVKKFNYASKCVAERNGLELIRENSDWWYYSI